MVPDVLLECEMLVALLVSLVGVRLLMLCPVLMRNVMMVGLAVLPCVEVLVSGVLLSDVVVTVLVVSLVDVRLLVQDPIVLRSVAVLGSVAFRNPVALHVVVVLFSVVLHSVPVLVAQELLVDVLLVALVIAVVSGRLLVPTYASPGGLAMHFVALLVTLMNVRVLVPLSVEALVPGVLVTDVLLGVGVLDTVVLPSIVVLDAVALLRLYPAVQLDALVLDVVVQKDVATFPVVLLPAAMLVALLVSLVVVPDVLLEDVVLFVLLTTLVLRLLVLDPVALPNAVVINRIAFSAVEVLATAVLLRFCCRELSSRVSVSPVSAAVVGATVGFGGVGSGPGTGWRMCASGPCGLAAGSAVNEDDTSTGSGFAASDGAALASHGVLQLVDDRDLGASLAGRGAGGGERFVASGGASAPVASARAPDGRVSVPRPVHLGTRAAWHSARRAHLVAVAFGLVLDDPGVMSVLGVPRCKRFSTALIEDGVIKTLNVSAAEGDPAGDDDPSASLVEKMLQERRHERPADRPEAASGAGLDRSAGARSGLPWATSRRAPDTAGRRNGEAKSRRESKQPSKVDPSKHREIRRASFTTSHLTATSSIRTLRYFKHARWSLCHLFNRAMATLLQHLRRGLLDRAAKVVSVDLAAQRLAKASEVPARLAHGALPVALALPQAASTITRPVLMQLADGLDQHWAGRHGEDKRDSAKAGDTSPRKKTLGGAFGRARGDALGLVAARVVRTLPQLEPRLLLHLASADQLVRCVGLMFASPPHAPLSLPPPPARQPRCASAASGASARGDGGEDADDDASADDEGGPRGAVVPLRAAGLGVPRAQLAELFRAVVACIEASPLRPPPLQGLPRLGAAAGAPLPRRRRRAALPPGGAGAPARGAAGCGAARPARRRCRQQRRRQRRCRRRRRAAAKAGVSGRPVGRGLRGGVALRPRGSLPAARRARAAARARGAQRPPPRRAARPRRQGQAGDAAAAGVVSPAAGGAALGGGGPRGGQAAAGGHRGGPWSPARAPGAEAEVPAARAGGGWRGLRRRRAAAGWRRRAARHVPAGRGRRGGR
ncbi:unnamed protein product, partial [Prorocentrum cordatum]